MQAKIPPPIVGAIVAAAMYGVSKSPGALAFDTGFNSWIGAGLMVLGALIALLGVAQFRRHRTTINPLEPEKASALVTTGIFRISRNPMYVGILFALIGIGFLLGSAGALIVALLFAPLITALQIRAEEAAMRERFGSEFDDYAARVRRWI